MMSCLPIIGEAKATLGIYSVTNHSFLHDLYSLTVYYYMYADCTNISTF